MNPKLLLLTPMAFGRSLVIALLLAPQTAIAQSIIPATDGTGTAVTTQGNQLNITGGTRSGDGTNLFHSFDQFNLAPGTVANFLSTPNTQNILGRVIGGTASEINGQIQITGGLSNLYLLNPAGIIFGANASLNLPGTFTATTADRLQFNAQWWDLTTPIGQLNALTGSPTGFGFSAAAAGTLAEPLQGSIANAGQLSAPSITLLGGQVIHTGTIAAPGGNVTIAAVQGERFVRISQTGHLLSLELPLAPQSSAGDAIVTGNITTAANNIGDGGNITIWADRDSRVAGRINADGGSQSGNGGHIATSGQRHIDLTGSQVTSRAPQGTPGTWTIDPTDIDIIAGGTGSVTGGLFDPATPSQIDPGTIATAIDGGTNVTITTSSGLGGLGDIRLLSPINQTGSSTASLSLIGRRAHSPNGSTINLASTGNLILNLNAINPEPIVATSSVQAAIDLIGSTNGNRQINLGAGLYAGDTLRLDRNLTLNGLSPTQTILSGETLRPVVNVSPISTATLSNLTITNGLANGAIGGGGISNAGSLTLNNTIVQQNQSNSSGGGIENSAIGNLIVIFSAITNNTAITNGGGINNNSQTSMINSDVANNIARVNGGGIMNGPNGQLDLTNTRLTTNQATLGGGIYGDTGSSLQAQTTTIATNQAQQGGGIFLLPNSTARLTQSTLSQNTSQSIGGGIASYGTLDVSQSGFDRNSAGTYGGGLFTNGNATLTASNWDANQATIGGGGIADFNQLQGSDLRFTNNRAETGGGYLSAGISRLDRSRFSGNQATIDGGGIRIGFPSTPSQFTLTHSELQGNRATDRGGAIAIDVGANITIDQSTIADHLATTGGGIFNNGNTRLTNVTLSGNQATTSGAIQIDTGNVTIASTTITNNTATSQSGGITNVAGNLTIQNTIVAGNIAPITDIAGRFTDQGNNLIGIDPRLAPLANYGGANPTHALLPGSVALDAGNAAAPATDQRGIARVGPADIGAFESRGFTVTAIRGTPQTTEINTAFPQPLTVSVTSTTGEPVDGGQITFTPPSGGASTISGPTTVTIAASQASIPAQANGTAGGYTVTAASAGIAAPETFNLINTITPVPPIGPPTPPIGPIPPIGPPTPPSSEPTPIPPDPQPPIADPQTFAITTNPTTLPPTIHPPRCQWRRSPTRQLTPPTHQHPHRLTGGCPPDPTPPDPTAPNAARPNSHDHPTIRP